MIALAAGPLGHADAPGPISTSLQREAEAAQVRALLWLAKQQQPSGAWPPDTQPAFTALPLWALAASRPANRAPLRRASARLTAFARPDGAIAPEQADARRARIDTALAVIALRAADDPRVNDAILNGRAFLAAHAPPSPCAPDADAALHEALAVAEGMRLTERVEPTRGDAQPRADLDWDALRAFLLAQATNKTAGTTGDALAPSSGSRVWPGLLALVYVTADPEEPCVQSAFLEAAREGLTTSDRDRYARGFLLAKACLALGRERIPSADGQARSWRESILHMLVGLQRIDPDTGLGYWVNDRDPGWESDPVIATAYALLALTAALP